MTIHATEAMRQFLETLTRREQDTLARITAPTMSQHARIELTATVLKELMEAGT